jgi:uncharacterized membrane protein
MSVASGPGAWTVGALVAAAAVVVALLVAQRPPVSRQGVVASLPWFVTGATLHAFPDGLGYPEALSPLLSGPWAYLSVGVVGGLVWTLLNLLTPGRGVAPAYVGSMGVGVLLPPVVLLVVQGGLADPRVLALWVAVPLLAVLVAYATLLALGVCFPEPAYFAGVVGAVVVFGCTVDGVATALVVELGAGSVSLALPAVAGGDPRSLAALHPLVLPGVLVWSRLALGVAALVGLELLNRTRPRLADRALAAATVGSVVLGANTFMLVLGRGWLG